MVERVWRKSSYSNGANGNCVEVAFGPDQVGVRDSKNANGSTLRVCAEQWRGFLRKVVSLAD
jgi:hypothetical protein